MTVTLFLIIVNSALSLAALYAYPRMLQEGILQPYYTIREGRWYQLVSSGFLHANFVHLFVNMFTLYFFGTVMEHTLGRGQFLGLYLASLILSGIPSLIKYRDEPSFGTLGASGAVEGVLFAFILLYPMEPIYLFLIPIPIPAVIFGVLFLLYSIYENKQDRGVINHEAHIAGAASGVLYVLLMVPNAIPHIMRTLGL